MNRRRTLPFSLAVAFLIAACGSSSSSDPTDDPCVGSACADGGARDGGSSTDGGGRTCTPRCGTDFDCASTCPSGGNVHCCDLPTGTCYQNASAVCTHTPDSGSGDSGGLPYP